MILHNQIANFGLEEVAARLQTDAQGFISDFGAFSAQDLTLSDAGIGLDRKLLYTWKKQGLLPHAGLPKKRGRGKNWGKFSFIELCWIKVLMECRAVGIGIDKLKEVTSFFYPTGFIKEFFSKPVENLAESLDPETLKLAQQKNLIKGDEIVINDQMIKMMEQLQFSLFSCLLYATMLSKKHYMLYMDSHGKFDVLDLDTPLRDPIVGVMEIYKLLSQETVLFVNIRTIIADLSGTHEHFSQNLRLGQMMSDSSVEILKDQFRDGQVKEVTIRVNEEGRPLAIIRSKMDIKDLEKQVRRLRKQGNYCDLVVKTRDGHIKYFEHTEIIKL